MSRIGVLQLESGVAGDMFLGALAGAGADFEAMRTAVKVATGGRGDLSQESVSRGGIQATKVHVLVDGKPLGEDPGHFAGSHGTTWKTIDAGLAKSDLKPGVKESARKVFLALGEAEAQVHGSPLETVHFHELGGLDAIADIVGTVAGLASLDLTGLYHGPINVGGGTVATAHGQLPVPAPATLELLKGRVLEMHPGGGELVTPTGAALLVACAQPLESPVKLIPEQVGMGAGTRDCPDRPNVVRLVIGVPDGPVSTETVGVVEASLDDCTPEDIGHLVQRFLDEGAYDATVTPLLMKKGRPGFLLRLLVSSWDVEEWASRVTQVTSSLGARWRVEPRYSLPRRMDTVEIPEGSFRVKVALVPDGAERPHVEFEDLQRTSRETGRPIGELRRLVERAWEQAQ